MPPALTLGLEAEVTMPVSMTSFVTRAASRSRTDMLRLWNSGMELCSRTWAGARARARWGREGTRAMMQ